MSMAERCHFLIWRGSSFPVDAIYQQSHEEIRRAIASLNPKSLLIIGPESEPQCLASDEQFKGIKKSLSEIDSGQVLDDQERYELVYFYGLEHYDKEKALNLIASLRDLHSIHLFVSFALGEDWASEDANSQWTLKEMIACGLHLHKQFGESNKGLLMCRFELSDYKTTPDWLNSKYWANPELYNKYRW